MIADRFLSARRTTAGLHEYPGQLPETLDQAYAIQDAAIVSWRRPIIGWKVGRVPQGLVAKLGADRLAGPIFESRKASSDVAQMPVFEHGFAAGEAEFLLRIGTAPDAGKTSYTLDEIRGCIDSVHVGIEVASSPLGAINKIGPMAVISDFGNNNGMVIGPPVENWLSSGFEDWNVTTRIDGSEVGTGTASSFPDGAFGAAKFLLELLARRGIALQPGQWISSGAVSGVHDARPGQLVEADFGGRLQVSCRLVAAVPQ
ncbi:MAG: 2-keto-4-pentenoate hydratase [Sphingomicrobium sp.]